MNAMVKKRDEQDNGLRIARSYCYLYQLFATGANLLLPVSTKTFRLIGVRLQRTMKTRLDPLSPVQRSERMSRVRSKDTKPEKLVRSITFSLGYRYRIHASDLPGSPDIIFRSRRKVIFVHGCFWHLHGCNHYKMPQSRKSFWDEKLQTNKSRDKRTYRKLRRLGWRYLILWECQIAKKAWLCAKISSFLEG